MSLTVASESPAQQMTVGDYDGFPKNVQAQIVADVLQKYHDHFQKEPETQYKAECMVRLYEPQIEGAGPHLVNLILSQLDQARANGPSNHTVVGVVGRVIDRECEGS